MAPLLRFDCSFQYASGFQLEAKLQVSRRITALFGPSGSGKTTMLSLIAGLLKPREGTICLRERLLTDSASRVFLPPEQRRIGYLFQDHRLFPHLRVKQNIAYGAKRRASTAISSEQIIEALELKELLHRFPDSLSGGQQQRVALARAIASNPELLLLDEPLNSVEAELSDRILSFIKQTLDEFQIPALVVSHNRKVVETLANKVVEIQNGHVIHPENDEVSQRP